MTFMTGTKPQIRFHSPCQHMPPALRRTSSLRKPWNSCSLRTSLPWKPSRRTPVKPNWSTITIGREISGTAAPSIEISEAISA